MTNHRVLKPAWNWKQYFQFHREAGLQGIQQLFKVPLTHFLILWVIALALLMPVGLLVFIKQINVLAAHWGQNNSINVYFKEDLGSSQLQKIKHQIWTSLPKAQLTYISSQEGLKTIASQLDTDVSKALTQEALPSVIKVQPKTSLTLVDTQRITQVLQRLPNVDQVYADLMKTEQIMAYTRMAGKLSVLLTLICCLSVFLVIGNTLKLLLNKHQAEVELFKLIGATQAQIKRPFLYFGSFLGMSGGILAIIFMLAIYVWLKPSLNYLSQTLSYAVPWNLPSPVYPSAFIVLSVFLGWFGAWWVMKASFSR